MADCFADGGGSSWFADAREGIATSTSEVKSGRNIAVTVIEHRGLADPTPQREKIAIGVGCLGTRRRLTALKLERKGG